VNVNVNVNVNARDRRPRGAGVARRRLRTALFAGPLMFAVASLASALERWPIWMRLPEGVSSYSGKIDGMFHLITWITGIVFVIVEGLLLIFLFRYRHKEGRKAHYTHGNNRLEVIWTIIPALICVVLALLSRRTWADIKQNMPKDAMPIEITAEQFSWTIVYPGPDGRFGTSDDIISLNQLHFPVGRPVVATLRSKDVIHSFFLPEFRVKQDAVPGMSTRIWFDGMRTGHWEIACAELCGLGHYKMKGYVTVETPEEFDKWLATQVAEAAPVPAAAAAAGAPVSAAPQEAQPEPGAMPPASRKPDAGPAVPATSPAPAGQEAKPVS
jgi:cytochrome c oxidase subunit 2